MESKEANHSIRCSVRQCEYHCGDENFCSLDAVKVGTHENDPTVCECTDCQSFSRG